MPGVPLAQQRAMMAGYPMVVDLVMARTYPPKKRSTCDVDNDDGDDGTDEDEGSLFSLFYINTILTISIIILHYAQTSRFVQHRFRFPRFKVSRIWV